MTPWLRLEREHAQEPLAPLSRDRLELGQNRPKAYPYADVGENGGWRGLRERHGGLASHLGATLFHERDLRS